MDELTARDICTWLEEHKDQTLFIKKEEQDDTDHVELQVKEVGLMEFSDTLDDYFSPKAIVLQGEGMIETSNGIKLKLPEDSYEIPLGGACEGIQKENGLEIRTERAHYSIFIH